VAVQGRAPETRRRDLRRTLGWAVAGLLFLVLTLPAFISSLDDDPATALGILLGRAGIALLVACALRWIYLRLRKSPNRLWSPWVLAIAAAFLLLLGLGRVAGQAQHTSASGERIASVNELFVELPAGLRYAPPPAREARQFEASFREQAGSSNANIEVRRISSRNGARALVIAALGDKRADLGEIEQSFERAGGSAAVERIDGTEFLVGKGPRGTGGAIAYRADGEAVVFILAASETDLRAFARPFADG